MFFTCLIGWVLTNCVFAGVELLLYDKTFLHWGDIASIIFWGGLWLYLRLRRLEKQTINVNIYYIQE